MKHKEYGSDFYYPIAAQWCVNNPSDSFFSSTKVPLFFSGRAALFHLLSFGITTHNWKEVYLPSYYCHEVYRFIKDLSIKVHYYAFNPLFHGEIAKESIPDRSDCVLVTVSYFGLAPATTNFDKTIIIEDITHNLQLLESSRASYCFGSLRKELPLPLGGFCYSPQGYSLPVGIPDSDANEVSAQRIKAMRFKRDYLNGIGEDKTSYRNILANTEKQFEASFTQAAMPENAVEILLQLDMYAILEQKVMNLHQAFSELKGVHGMRLLGSADNKATFGLVLQCRSKEERDSLKSYLILNNIFPAILWPEQENEEDRMLEDTLLFIHTDFRYSSLDISVITQMIKAFFANE